MTVFVRPLQRLLLQLLLLLCFYSISRAVFTLINADAFAPLSIGEYLPMALYGLRFDVSTIFMVNIVYIFLALLPIPVQRAKWWDRFLQVLFVTTNMLALCFEVSDWAYFPFTMKRATADVLHMVGRKSDFLNLLPSFAVNYWYVFIAIIAMAIIFIRLNKRIHRIYAYPDVRWTATTYIARALILVLSIGGSVIAVRGGIQNKPLNIGNSLQAADGKRAAIVINTPYSIIATYANDKVEDYHFYRETELKQYVDPIKPANTKGFRAKNVVIIVLESFSKQFTGLDGKFKSYTPFLDSLMQHAYVCNNAYANALHSAEGIPAVIAGIPALTVEPFTTSYYGMNSITALPNLLAPKGYSSAFYHGGTNGTMNFDILCANAGYQHYYGRSEYNNEKDYDGNWGIWDEPFLQYTASGLSKMKQPFVSTVFTLSSHDPFNVPEQYKDVLPKGELKILQCIAYTDMALRKFFARISREPFFNNTVFIITPDHCSLQTQTLADHSNLGFYRIPLMLYAPGDTTMTGVNSNLTQQIDILPTVLDYLGYDKPFFALGNSMFNPPAKPFVVNMRNPIYEMVIDNYIFKTKKLDIDEVYNYSLDSNCQNNLLTQPEGIEAKKKYAPYLKAYIQTYHSALIHNTMRVQP
jgi:phosphoglycerol transferase MdoB-like AlkP superfamily enzyme